MPFVNATERDTTTEPPALSPAPIAATSQQRPVTDTSRFPMELLSSRCPAMQQVFCQAKRVAPTGATVFITGESGSGKEVLAQFIHRQSERSNQPFVAVNCGGLSPQLIDSELFGHEKGSFTGAIREHRGVFEQANGGTLFLDEITEMPLELQVKLLRVLESRRLVRVGGEREVVTDVRIIAATNRCPQQMIHHGRLRADLLYRLQVFPLVMPPLRERKADVPDLARYFLSRLNQGQLRQRRFTTAALSALVAYHWPGNLRELNNRVQRSFILADQYITPAHFPGLERPEVAPEKHSQHDLTITVGSSVAEVEKQLILATLTHCHGRKDQAVAMLGVSLKTLYNRLRLYQNQTRQSGQ